MIKKLSLLLSAAFLVSVGAANAQVTIDTPVLDVNLETPTIDIDSGSVIDVDAPRFDVVDMDATTTRVLTYPAVTTSCGSVLTQPVMTHPVVLTQPAVVEPVHTLMVPAPRIYGDTDRFNLLNPFSWLDAIF